MVRLNAELAMVRLRDAGCHSCQSVNEKDVGIFKPGPILTSKKFLQDIQAFTDKKTLSTHVS